MFKIIVLCLLIACLHACSNESESVSESYCKNLAVLAKQEKIKIALRGWVINNVIKKKIDKKKLYFGGQMWPGDFLLERDFNWSKLGFGKHSQIRLVGPKAGDRKKIGVKNIKSVFFGEISRYGILVKMPTSDGFGVNNQYLKYIEQDIAVVCRVIHD